MAIKKAELHTHLEGTISPNLARKLAKRNKLVFENDIIAADGESYTYNDFLDFLKTYDKVAAVIKHPQDYYDITYDYLCQNAEGDTIYTEMMYSPDHAEQSSGIPSIEHLNAIQTAINDAENKFDIVGRIIITGVRHFGADAVTKVAQEIAKKSLPCVVGFGLGGDEANFPPKLFTRAYQIAADAGLYCTVHAGEFASAAGVREAIDNLPIKRIGHGVQVIHSPEVQSMLKEKNIALEICPSSNIRLGLFPDFKNHPLPQLLEAGIRISLNSDDPPFMSTNVAREYDLVQKHYSYSDQDMKNITRMAIEDAFCDAGTKKRLLSQIS